MRVPKSLRNAVLGVVVLIVLFGLAGVAYTLFAGSPEVKPRAQSAPKPDANTYSAPKPVQPAPNTPVGVSVVSLLSPVLAGSNTSVSIRTIPTAICTISVAYNGVASTDSGLAAKTADAYGMASWTWTVGRGVPPGNWPVKVSCSHNGRSAVVQTLLQVTR